MHRVPRIVVASLLASFLLASLPASAEVDADHDGVPGLVDDNLCTRALVEEAVNTVKYLGHCDSQPPYGYTPPTVDTDGDGVPDVVDENVCTRAIMEQAINQIGLAGHCDPTPPYDYTPPTF